MYDRCWFFLLEVDFVIAPRAVKTGSFTVVQFFLAFVEWDQHDGQETTISAKTIWARSVTAVG